MKTETRTYYYFSSIKPCSGGFGQYQLSEEDSEITEEEYDDMMRNSEPADISVQGYGCSPAECEYTSDTRRGDTGYFELGKAIY